MIPINDLSRAVNSDNGGIRRGIDRVLASGWYSGGAETQDFAREFSAYIGTKQCIGVGNGTDALTLALLGLGMCEGSRVATVANAGFYSSSAIIAAGAEPVYVDVDLETACMDNGDLNDVLVAGDVDCVVVTHLYGQMADMPAITETCRAAGIPLLEDCAQAAGADIGGKRAGAWGDAAAFSFYPTKNLGALGDGGAVVTSSPEVAAAVGSFAQYGWSERYIVDHRGGRNSRLDELQAAVLRHRLPQLEQLNNRRRWIAGRYAATARDCGHSVMWRDSSDYVAHLAVIRHPKRDQLQHELRERGVGTHIHYPVPDHLQLAMTTGEDEPRKLPTTEALCSEVLTLPNFPELTDAEVETVCAALKDSLAAVD